MAVTKAIAAIVGEEAERTLQFRKVVPLYRKKNMVVALYGLALLCELPSALKISYRTLLSILWLLHNCR